MHTDLVELFIYGIGALLTVLGSTVGWIVKRIGDDVKEMKEEAALRGDAIAELNTRVAVLETKQEEMGSNVSYIRNRVERVIIPSITRRRIDYLDEAEHEED